MRSKALRFPSVAKLRHNFNFFASVKKALALLAISISLGLVWAHPFYVSMTEIRHNEKANMLEVSVRVFTDDLEKQLASDCNCKVDMSRKKDSTVLAGHLKRYVPQSLRFQVDGKPLQLVLVGFEKEEESTWSYWQSIQEKKIGILQVTNRLLYQTQPRQTNLVRFIHAKGDVTRQVQFPKESLVF